MLLRLEGKYGLDELVLPTLRHNAFWDETNDKAFREHYQSKILKNSTEGIMKRKNPELVRCLCKRSRF